MFKNFVALRNDLVKFCCEVNLIFEVEDILLHFLLSVCTRLWNSLFFLLSFTPPTFPEFICLWSRSSFDKKKKKNLITRPVLATSILIDIAGRYNLEFVVQFFLIFWYVELKHFLYPIFFFMNSIISYSSFGLSFLQQFPIFRISWY